MTRIKADFLDEPGLQQILAMLEKGGHQALIVGGAVRNALLGEPVADVDLTTDARPDRVIALAGAAGLRALPTGISHGTVTLLTEGTGPRPKSYEVTSFRHDIATDGRHAEVAFCDDLAQDAQRRDFTMNALYATADGRVLDPVGGLADLQGRRLRFVGDPRTRITEDFLRILRFFRFHAWHGAKGQADPAALAACRALADGLAHLSRERIGSEMLKLLAAPDPSEALHLMQDNGVLARVLPGAQLSLIDHLPKAAPPDALLRLAALGGDDPQRDLRLDNSAARELSRLARLSGERIDLRRAAYGYGAQTATRLALLLLARGETLPDDWRCQVSDAARQVLPLRAADLMPAITGPALGHALRRAEDHWIDSGFSASQDELLDVARKATSRKDTR